MTEKDLQQAVVGLAHTFGYRAMHTRPVLTHGRWVTPLQGDAGYPDLVLCGRGRILYRELKSDDGRLTDEQRAWGVALELAGADYAVWRPGDWPEPILSHLRGTPAAHQPQEATL